MHLSNFSLLELYGTLIITITLLYYLSIALYNIFLHPLRKFPGPVLAAASPLYFAYYTIRGRRASIVRELHIQYGSMVRLSPNQLSCIGETAWKDIYGYKQGRPQLEKADRVRFRRQVYSIINAPDDVHARQRRMVSHAFSDRALRDQEPLLKIYVDSLVRNLHQDAQEGKEVDMVKAYNYTTFDIIGDFAFGETFEMLSTRQDHAILSTVFARIRSIVTLTTLTVIPGFRLFLLLFLKVMQREGFILQDFVSNKVSRRIDTGDTEKPDLMTGILKNNTEDGTGITRAEIDATASLLTIAGSETTATLLSGCTNLLLQNPRVMEKLKAELRGEFQSVEEITVPRLNKLPYIFAVLEESLRLYPPVPVALPRMTPPGGAPVSGYWVPGDMIIGIPQWAAYTSPSNFVDPLSFIPERWLASRDPKYENDKRSIVQPFSVGPRNCVGKNLAYTEMKLILARVIYDFDLEAVDSGVKWEDQRVFTLWEKGPLMVRLTERS